MEIAFTISIDGRRTSLTEAVQKIATVTKPNDLAITLNEQTLVDRGTMFGGTDMVMLKRIVDAEVSRRAMRLLMRVLGYGTLLMSLTAIVAYILR
jgi:hypothetical protein